MVTHILSLTYQPKIEAVKAGECRQTIRLKRSSVDKAPGDKLLLHTWAGKPYRSKWDWRMETTIKEVILLHVYGGQWHIWDDSDFKKYRPIQPHFRPIGNSEIEKIAKLDGIEPPTIYGLQTVLGNLNKVCFERTLWEVIRW